MSKKDEKTTEANTTKQRGKGRDFYVEMVKNDPRTRVTRVDATDTHILLNLTQLANRILSKSRAQAGRGIEFETFAEILSKFDLMVLEFGGKLEELSKLCKVKYREPKELSIIRGRLEKEEGERGEEDTKVAATA